MKNQSRVAGFCGRQSRSHSSLRIGMKRLALPSCFHWLVLLSMSVATSILLFDIGVAGHDIFVSALVLAARSNRAVAYVVFNFIIVVIFLGFLRSSKQTTGGDIDGMFSMPPSLEQIHHETMLIEEENKEVGDSEDEYHGYDGYEEDNDDDMEAEEDEDSEAEEGDSDLERRSEEFIAKMNSKWREELLHERFLCMVYASSPKLELL